MIPDKGSKAVIERWTGNYKKLLGCNNSRTYSKMHTSVQAYSRTRLLQQICVPNVMYVAATSISKLYRANILGAAALSALVFRKLPRNNFGRLCQYFRRYCASISQAAAQNFGSFASTYFTSCRKYSAICKLTSFWRGNQYKNSNSNIINDALFLKSHVPVLN